MRNHTFTQNQASRVIGARVTFDDYRLRFTDLPTSDLAYTYYDCSVYNNGILELAWRQAESKMIYYRYSTTLTGTLASWKSQYVDYPNEVGRFGLYQERLFYVDASMSLLKYIEYRSGTDDFGTPVNTTISAGGKFVAPVSKTKCYLGSYLSFAGDYGGNNSKFAVDCVEYVTSTWVLKLASDYQREFPLEMCGAGGGEYCYFDAEEIDGHSYIFYMNETRSMVMRDWSVSTPIVPIDIVDDISSFQMGMCSVMDNKIFLSGLLKRSNGPTMWVYMRGADKLRNGRDTFITDQYLTRSHFTGGKMMLIDDKVWFWGMGIRLYAPATSLVGYANSAKTYTTTDIVDLSLECGYNQPYQLNFTLKSDVSHASIRDGSKLKLEVLINSSWFSLGYYGIDAVQRDREDTITDLKISARSFAMREMSNWVSDAPYDFWSQEKLSCNPADMSKVVLFSGEFENHNNTLSFKSLNTEAFASIMTKASEGGLARIQFNPRASSTAFFRVGLGALYKDVTAFSANSEPELAEGLSRGVAHTGVYAIFTCDNSGRWSFPHKLLIAQRQPNNTWNTLQQVVASSFAAFQNSCIQFRYWRGKYAVAQRLASATDWTLPALGADSGALPRSEWQNPIIGHLGIYLDIPTNAPAWCYGIKNYSAVDWMVCSQKDEGAYNRAKVEDEVIAFAVIGQTSAPTLQSNVHRVVLGTHIENSDGAGTTAATFGNSTTYTKWRLVYGKLSIGANAHWGIQAFGIKLEPVGYPADNVIIKISGFSDIIIPGSFICDNYYSHKPIELDGVSYRDGELLVSLANQSAEIALQGGTPFPPIVRTFEFTMERSGAVDANHYYKIYHEVAAYSAPYVNTAYWNGSTWVALNTVFGGTLLTVEAQSDNTVGLGNALVLEAPNDMYYKDAGTDRFFVALAGETAIQSPPASNPRFSHLLVNKNYRRAHAGFRSFLSTDHKESYGVFAPAYQISTRGYGGTTQADHKNCMAKPMPLYTYPYISLDLVEAFTGERDLSVVDIITEIGSRAGVEVVPDTLLPVSVTPSTNTTVVTARNFILKLSGITGTANKIVIDFRKPTANASTDGPCLEIDIANSALVYNKYLAGVVKVEKITVPAITGEVTVSLQENFLSIWQYDALLHVFTLSTADAALAGTYLWLHGTYSSALTCSLPSALERVDNFLLDEGSDGVSLAGKAIGEKRVYFQDNMDGKVRVYRGNTAVNTSGTPYTLTISKSDTMSDIDYATRVRIEGVEIKEKISAAEMADHGDLYRLIHANEVIGVIDAENVADITLAEFKDHARIVVLAGAADPRLEPKDLIYVTLPDGVVAVVIENIKYEAGSDPGSAFLDMQITGYVRE